MINSRERKAVLFGKRLPRRRILERKKQMRDNIYNSLAERGIARHRANEFIRGNAIRNLEKILNPQELAEAAQDLTDAMYKHGKKIEEFVMHCETISNKYINEASRKKQRMERL